MPSYPEDVKKVYYSSGSELPSELQFLPPDEHKAVYEGYKRLHQAEDGSQIETQLIVDGLIYFTIPELLRGRLTDRRRFPTSGDELYMVIEHFILKSMEIILEWKKIKVSAETKLEVCYQARDAIWRHCTTADYGVSQTIRMEDAYKRRKAKYEAELASMAVQQPDALAV